MTQWQKILADLREKGMSREAISRELHSMGSPYSARALNQLAAGRIIDPSHSVGEHLLKIHQQKTRD